MNAASKGRVERAWTWPVVALLFSLTGPVLADNKAMVEAMSVVIQKDDRFTDAHKRALCDIVAEVLLKAPDLERDKAEHAAEHLRVYLEKELLRASHPYSRPVSDSEFKVVDMKFRWSLGNYVRLPAILAIDRETLALRLAVCKEAVAAFIEDTHTDTPADVRQKLIARTQERLDDDADMLGNYFFPRLLYPAKKDASPKDVRRELAKEPMDGDEFASTERFLARNPDNQEYKERLLESFLFSHSLRRASGCYWVMGTVCCDLGKAGKAYKDVPKALQTATDALSKEFRRQQEAPAGQPASQPAVAPAR